MEKNLVNYLVFYTLNDRFLEKGIYIVVYEKDFGYSLKVQLVGLIVGGKGRFQDYWLYLN